MEYRNLKQRRKRSVRAQSEPIDIGDMRSLSGGSARHAGVIVTPESAQTFSAVYRAVRVIAGTIASMPLKIYDVDNANKPVTNTPVAQKLRSGLSKQTTNVVFWDALIADLPLRGDGIALIVRTVGGEFVGLIHIPRHRCSIWRRTNGEVAYTCTLDNGIQVTRYAVDVIHIPNFGWNGLHGISTLSYAAGSIGVGLAADGYSSDFFSNDSTPNGYLKFNKRITNDVATFLLNYWESRHMGAGKRHRTAIVPDGGEWVSTGISPSDAQLIESRRFQVNDIARFFGVPLHLLQEMDKSSSWATGLEQQNLAFILYTLQPYISRIEQELTNKLLPSGFEARYDSAALLKADAKTRYEGWQIAIGGNQMPGWLTINEVRARESLEPIEGGNVLYSPLSSAVQGQQP